MQGTLRNDIIKIILGAIVGAFIVLQFKGCGKEKDCLEVFKSKTEIETSRDSDTLIVHHTDTVYESGPTKYIYLDKPSSVSENDDSTFTYTHIIFEDDLAGAIRTRTTGKVLSLDLEYEVTCPVITKTDSITITHTDTVKITTDNFIEKKRRKLFLGTEAAFADKSGILGAAFNFTIQGKNDYQFYYEYGVSFNKTVMPDQHRIGVKIPIRFK